jgi:hypothetical protein
MDVTMPLLNGLQTTRQIGPEHDGLFENESFEPIMSRLSSSNHQLNSRNHHPMARVPKHMKLPFW